MDAWLDKLEGWSIQHVSWEENKLADALVGVAAALPIQETTMLPIYLQATLSISHEWVKDIIQMDLGWMEDIVKYLHTRVVLKDGKETHKFRVQATWYT